MDADSIEVPRYDVDELVYAGSLEKAYGLKDDAYAYYCEMQRRLSRFETWPALDAASAERARELGHYRDELLRRGFDPLTRDDMLEAVRVDFVHSTAALEGGTLSVFEVAQLLSDGTVSPHATFRQHQEVVDIDDAFSFALAELADGRRASIELACETHALAAAHLEDARPGKLRDDQRYVQGSRILPPPPSMVSDLLRAALDWYEAAPSLERAVGFHLVFEDIHPFADGNGRTGRVLLDYMLMQEGYPAIAIKPDAASNREYHAAVRDFSASVSHRDASRLFALVDSALSRELSRHETRLEQSLPDAF